MGIVASGSANNATVGGALIPSDPVAQDGA